MRENDPTDDTGGGDRVRGEAPDAEALRRDAAPPLIPTGWFGPHPVFDLAAIPEERWTEAFMSTSPSLWARMARSSVALPREACSRAHALWFQLEMREAKRVEAARQRARHPVPLPGRDGMLPRPPRRRPQRQVAFRLHADVHDRLADAASLLGLRPTQLGRMLTLRGVDQVLAETGADD